MKITKQYTKYVVEHGGEKYHATVLHDGNTTSVTKVVWQDTPLGEAKCYHVPVYDWDTAVPESDLERRLEEALS
jgi:hypothetical protein